LVFYNGNYGLGTPKKWEKVGFSIRFTDSSVIVTAKLAGSAPRVIESEGMLEYYGTCSVKECLYAVHMGNPGGR
jgi:hypothetical protein